MSKVPLIPIKRGEDASTYRYKMPRVTNRSISSGNGVKAAVLNANDVAKAIARSPQALAQWFGYSLVTQSKYQATNGQIILNGSHEQAKLQEHIYAFIDNFVLCPICGNPETTLSKSGNNLVSHCSACGQNANIGTGTSTPCSRMHNWFITHIQTETQKPTNVTTATSRGKLDAIDDFQRSVGEGEDTQGIYISVEELTALEKKIDGAQVETEEKKDLTDEEFDAFHQKLMEMCNSDATNSEIYQFFTSTADQCGWASTPRLKMIHEAVFLGHKEDFVQVIEKRRGLLLRFVMEEDSEKVLFGIICSSLESTSNSELLTSAPVIFQALYDNEIVQEKTMKEWFTGKPSKFEKNKTRIAELKKQVDIFFQWLANAQLEPEPESESENEEAEEEKIDIDDI